MPMVEHHLKTIHPQPPWSLTPKHIIRDLVIVFAMVLLLPLAANAIADSYRSSVVGEAITIDTNVAQLYSGDPTQRSQAIQSLGQAAQAGSGEALAHLARFFQHDEYLSGDGVATARAIASAGTPAAYQLLLETFKRNQSPQRRYASMAALENARPNVTHELIAALQDPDAGVRSTSAELLGYRRALNAVTALNTATSDADPTVRAAAAWTLGGDLGVWNSLPRLQQLQATDPDAQVRSTAARAEGHIRNQIASALGFASTDLLLVSAAPANNLLYAATPTGLYAIHDSTSWWLAGTLPDYPTALAAGGSDGQQVYLGTIGSGPFRSVNGGQSWERIRNGLPAAERLTVTSLTISAGETQARQSLTMELAVTVGTSTLHTTPLGVFRSEDSGTTWFLLDKAH